MNNKKAFIFSGFGSQEPKMGKDLFGQFPSLVGAADEILGYSVEDLCLDMPRNLEKISMIQYTCPALYVVTALGYLKRIEEGMEPDFIAGHSLGENVALFAAGAYDFETGLKIANLAGQAMSRVSGGGVAIVIGLEEEKIRRVLEKNFNTIEIVNFNAPKQYVIAGLKGEMDEVKPLLINAGQGVIYGRWHHLSQPIHSEFMRQAAVELERSIGELDPQLCDPEIPVVSCITAELYTGKNLRGNMLNLLTCPVRWTDTVRYLLGEGVAEFESIGPGKALARTIEEIKESI